MKRESGKFNRAGCAVGPPGQGYAQYFRCTYRIFAESLVEVAHPEQEYRVRVFGLDGIILLHQRCFDIFLHLRYLQFYTLAQQRETKLKISRNLSITFIINSPQMFGYICQGGS